MGMKEDKMALKEYSIETQLDLSELELALIHAYIIEAMAVINKNLKIARRKQAELRIKKSRG